MNILIELGLMVAILYGAYFMGEENIRNQDKQALLEAHQKEQIAIKEVQDAKRLRDKLVENRITVVHNIKDTSGCLDLDLRTVSSPLVNSVRAANSR